MAFVLWKLYHIICHHDNMNSSTRETINCLYFLTDKRSSKISMCQVIHVVLISINIFPQNNSISTEKSFLCFQIDCFCSKMVTMATKIRHSHSRCVKLCIPKNLGSYSAYKRRYSRFIVLWLCGFNLWRQKIYCRLFLQNLQKTIFSVFQSFLSENCLDL